MGWLDRFESKIMQAEDGCWLWTGTVTGSGYGYFGRDGKTLRAHRVAYEHYVGPIPDGLHLHHLCRQKTCVNPDHLLPMTQGENNNQERRATCKRGHDMTDAYQRPDRPTRQCMECHVINKRALRARNREMASSVG